MGAFYKAFLLTEERDGLQHGTDLLHGTLSLAALVAEAAETVDPLQQPAPVRFGFFVKLLQKLRGNWEVFLERFAAHNEAEKVHQNRRSNQNPSGVHLLPCAIRHV